MGLASNQRNEYAKIQHISVILVLKGLYNHYFVIMYYKCINTHIINRTKTNTKINAQNTNSHTGNQDLFFAAEAGFEPT